MGPTMGCATCSSGTLYPPNPLVPCYDYEVIKRKGKTFPPHTHYDFFACDD